MKILLKFIEALGIAITGTGLMLGIARDSMADEYQYALVGVALFFITRFIETRAFPQK